MTIRAWAVREGDDRLLTPGPGELRALVADPAAVVWVDLDDNGPEEERILSEVFAFRHLVVEDVFEEALPKLEDHGEYLYLILHGVHPRFRDPHEVRTYVLDLFLGDRFVLTHHPGISPCVQQVRTMVEADPSLLRRGAVFLAHALVDYLVDAYVPLMEQFERSVEDLEENVYRPKDHDVLERIMDLKGSLQRIHRIGIHQRGILGRLREPGLRVIPEEMLPFFADVHDHFVRVGDLGDSLRDMVQANLDAFLSVQSYRMNEIMKVLTLISTIMLPLHLVAGIYGMNFRYMPELDWRWGYFVVLGVMATVVGALLLVFKRRGWL